MDGLECFSDCINTVLVTTLP